MNTLKKLSAATLGAACVTLGVSAGMAHSAILYTEATAPVAPVLERVFDNDNGTFSAVFGYRNDNADTVEIPIGEANKFFPDPQGRGQPTLFSPGRQIDVFEVLFNAAESPLVWTLSTGVNLSDTRTATTTIENAIKRPTPVPEPGVVLGLVVTGLAVLSYGKGRGDRLMCGVRQSNS